MNENESKPNAIDPQAVTAGGIVTDTVSLFDEDLSGVDTSMPKLAPGLYDLEIEEGEIKKDETTQKESLVVKLKTVADTKDEKGNPLNAGFPLFEYIALTPTEKLTKDAIKKRVATLVQAAGASKVSELKGKIVKAKVSIENERTDKNTGRVYPARNALRYVPLEK